MKISEQILQDLHNHMPLNKIAEKYPGKSALYTALEKFLAETDETLDKRYREIQNASAELTRLSSEDTRLKRQVELDNISQKRLGSNCQKLAEQGRQMKVAIEQLEVRSAKLKAEGYTPEIVAKLLGSNAQSPIELLERVATVEEHKNRKSELVEIQGQMSVLKKEIAAAQDRKQQIDREVASQRNTLDDMRIQVASFKDAIAVVASLFREGYGVEEITSLKAGLATVGIAGDNNLTVTRLVTALRKLKTITLIDEKIAEKRSELNELIKAAGEVKSKLSVAREVSLKSICEVSEAAKKTIAEVANQTKEHLKDTTETFDDGLAGSLAEADNRVKQFTEKLAEDLGEWSELKEQTARARELIVPGQALLGILDLTEDLNKVDLQLVARLFERLYIWFEIKLKDASAAPSESMNRKERGLLTYRKYKLSNLVEFLTQSLRQLVISEQSGKMENRR